MNTKKMKNALKLFCTFLVLCFTVLSGISLDTVTAKADTYDPNATYTFTNVNSNKIFDVEFESTDQGANIHQSTYYGDWSQQWRIQSTGDGYYKIVNANSGKVADVEGSSTSNGGNIHQWDYVGGENQKWSIEPVGSYYRIVNKNSGKVMDVQYNSTDQGANVHQWDYISGVTSQLWKIDKINAPLPGIDPTKYYKIKSGSMVWDVYGQSTGTMKIWLYGDNNGDNQKWKIVPYGPDTSPSFTIQNKNSGLKAVMNMGTSDGTKCVLQQSPYGSPMWVFEYYSPGVYKIKQWGSYGYVFGGSDLYVGLSNTSLYDTFTLELTN